MGAPVGACRQVISGTFNVTMRVAAANFAWVNRSAMTFLARQTFAKMFDSTPDDLDMHVVYDVSHNIAKVEQVSKINRIASIQV